MAPNDNARGGATHSITPSSGLHDEGWKESLERVIPAILVIRVSHVRAFDGEGASHSFASGFVVDAERGIVLSNRHVVSAGPTVADAITVTKEEIPLEPIYRDPVHDFGFFRLSAPMRFTRAAEIPLDPEGARVGTEIRVVGNDNAEKLSILPGILSRVDREAPQYGANTYNDFNTFYIAAASNTSGGSSGSPVLTADGVAVALNCGSATKAASAFYLPLHRVQRALQCLQRGQTPVRGTLQTIFKHTAFDEVRRLGLTAEAEAEVRAAAPGETGMLVVDQVLPEGPADGLLEPGDVLLRLGGGGGKAETQSEPELRLVTSFLPLAEALDDAVGAGAAPLQMEVQRGPCKVLLTVTVQDLEEITPSELLQVSGSVVHPLSYQQARNYHMPVRGPYVAQMGYMLARAGVSHHCVINSIGPTPTPDLDAFEAAFRGYPEGARVALSYTVLGDRHRSRTVVITVDRRWFSCCRHRRGDDGLWRPLPPLPPLLPPPAQEEAPMEQEEDSEDAASATFSARIQASLAAVSFDVPYQVDGITDRGEDGVGIVVDAELGIMICDRQTVPIALGDALITFGAALEVPGEVLFLHPIYNFVVIGFDAARVRAAGVPLEAAPLCPQALSAGKELEFFGITSTSKPVYQRSTVTKLEHLEFADPAHPQYMARNTEVVCLDRVSSCVGGVLCPTSSSAEEGDGEKRGVAAFYLAFNAPNNKVVWRGMPSGLVKQALEDGYRAAAMEGGGRSGWAPPRVRCVPAQLIQTPVSEARAGLGLQGHWAQQLQKRRKAQLLTVRRCTAGVQRSPAATVAQQQQQQGEKGAEISSIGGGGLETGDVLLTVGGELVTSFTELEEAVRHCPDGGSLRVAVLRKQREMTINVPVLDLPPIGTNRIILWAGLMLQAPHLAVLQLGFLPDVALQQQQQPQQQQSDLAQLAPMEVSRTVSEESTASNASDASTASSTTTTALTAAAAAASGASSSASVDMGCYGRGVYISRWTYGSPSQKYGAGATNFITKVNGRPTPCLDSFLAAVRCVADGEDVRLKVVDLNSKSSVLTLKTDLHYFPTCDLVRVGPGHWDMRGARAKGNTKEPQQDGLLGAGSTGVAAFGGAAAAADVSVGGEASNGIGGGGPSCGTCDNSSSTTSSSGGSGLRARWELREVEGIKKATVPTDSPTLATSEPVAAAAAAAVHSAVLEAIVPMRAISASSGYGDGCGSEDGITGCP